MSRSYNFITPADLSIYEIQVIAFGAKEISRSDQFRPKGRESSRIL